MKEITAGEITFYSPSGKNPNLFPGDTYDGVYNRTTTGNGKFKSENHYFTDKEGNTFVMSGSGKLNSLIQKVKPGTLVRIQYTGKTAIKSGEWKGSDAHEYRVFDLSDETAQSETDKVAAKVSKIYKEAKG